MSITVKDIAQEAHVSASTVSNALSGKGNVSEATRTRILELCEQMGYKGTEDAKARALEQGKSILFCFSEFGRHYYMRIIEGIYDCALAQKVDLLIGSSTAHSKYMDRHYTLGSIVLDAQWPDELLQRRASAQYPIIVVGRTMENPYIKSVTVNNYEAMSLLVQNLVTYGYRRMAFLSGPDTEDTRERYEAFLWVLGKNDILFLQNNYYQGDFTEASGYQTAKVILLSGSLPEVLVCANDNMAIGAMKAFQEVGLNIPQDIAVTGFDGLEASEALGLTTVEIPRYESGYLAAQQLLQLALGQGDFSTMKIAAKVQMRKSVAGYDSGLRS